MKEGSWRGLRRSRQSPERIVRVKQQSENQEVRGEKKKREKERERVAADEKRKKFSVPTSFLVTYNN